jgi:ribonucleoside-triphosphate reductase
MNGNQAMSDFVFTSTYARYDEDLMRRETFEEAVDRMVYMHKKKYADKDIDELIDINFDMVKAKKVLASQRALQFGGDPVLAKNMRVYNCATSYCDRIRFFGEALYMGLCGVGVGFSVQRIHTNCLPALITREDWSRKVSMGYTVNDSIEGWADALNALMEGYLSEAPLPDFDYDEIRPKGAKISAGGTAPGSEPLEVAIDKVEELLIKLVEEGVTHLEPIHCFDIMMFASEAVISGGRRRAATIALFDKNDQAMLKSKTGNWFVDNKQRGLANISAVHVLSDEDKESFDQLIQSAKEFGEPGIIFTNSPYYVYNPCVEIGMCPLMIKDQNGNIVETYTLDMLNNRIEYLNRGYTYESGWQTCNLTEINGGAVTEPTHLFEAAHAASVIGTLQAGYTDHGYLKPVSQEIIEREALLGVSITGIMENPDILLDKDLLAKAAELAVDTNRSVSEMIGIKPASRVTCVKPAGTTSIILGTSSGIHPHFGRRVIRHIQVNKDNPVLQQFQEINPTMCEESQWSSGGTDTVVAFPLQFPDTAKLKSDMTAVEFLECVKLVQNSWVSHGTSRVSCEGLTHNVSNTVSIKGNEWDSVSEFIWSNKETLTGVAMLGDFGESCYAQLPNQAVYTYAELCDRFGSKAVEHVIKGDYEAAESHVSDKDALSTLIYHTQGLEKWEKLSKSLNEVDYEIMIEAQDTTKPGQDSACSGQSCEVKFL